MKPLLTGLAVTTLMMSQAYASETEQQQILELKKEVEALKQLIQQQPAVHLAEVNSLATDAPMMVQNQSERTVPTISTPQQQESKQTSPLTWVSKSGAEVKLYGFARADAEYQIEGGDAMFNRINKVPLNNDPNKKKTEDKFESTVNTTRLGLDFKTPIEGHNVGGKVEIDFRGGANNDTVRVRHAYLTYDHWLIGQTTSSFLSTDISPEIIDFSSALGGGTFRTPMVRYQNKWSPQLNYSLSIEQASKDNRFPAVAGKMQSKFADNKGTFAVRGLVQETRIREHDDETKLGWGVGLGLKYLPVENTTVNLNYSHLKGDDKYLLYNADRYYVEDDQVRLAELDAVLAGVTYKFNPKLRSTIAYGGIFYSKNESTNNKSLQQGWINMLYNPIKPLTFGIEYIYGQRKTGEGLKGNDNRVGVMAKYDF